MSLIIYIIRISCQYTRHLAVPVPRGPMNEPITAKMQFQTNLALGMSRESIGLALSRHSQTAGTVKKVWRKLEPWELLSRFPLLSQLRPATLAFTRQLAVDEGGWQLDDVDGGPPMTTADHGPRGWMTACTACTSRLPAPEALLLLLLRATPHKPLENPCSSTGPYLTLQL